MFPEFANFQVNKSFLTPSLSTILANHHVSTTVCVKPSLLRQPQYQYVSHVPLFIPLVHITSRIPQMQKIVMEDLSDPELKGKVVLILFLPRQQFQFLFETVFCKMKMSFVSNLDFCLLLKCTSRRYPPFTHVKHSHFTTISLCFCFRMVEADGQSNMKKNMTQQKQGQRRRKSHPCHFPAVAM